MKIDITVEDYKSLDDISQKTGLFIPEIIHLWCINTKSSRDILLTVAPLRVERVGEC